MAHVKFLIHIALLKCRCVTARINQCMRNLYFWIFNGMVPFRTIKLIIWNSWDFIKRQVHML
jgi:hypothetical protein